jgi:hypothetical protein
MKVQYAGLFIPPRFTIYISREVCIKRCLDLPSVVRTIIVNLDTALHATEVVGRCMVTLALALELSTKLDENNLCLA